MLFLRDVGILDLRTRKYTPFPVPPKGFRTWDAPLSGDGSTVLLHEIRGLDHARWLSLAWRSRRSTLLFRQSGTNPISSISDDGALEVPVGAYGPITVYNRDASQKVALDPPTAARNGTNSAPMGGR